MRFTDSPVHTMNFEGQQIYVKRDDLLHLQFSGNKARKFAYFLECDLPNNTKLVGYGSPQANSLYSMAALAKLKHWQLDFYVDHIADHLRLNPIGNYKEALCLGANIINLADKKNVGALSCENFIKKKVLPNAENTIYVPEGGRCQYAEYGVEQLGREIALWKQSFEDNDKKLVIFLPSGTGTTALYLSKYFYNTNSNVSVYTCAAVGGREYLKKQFLMLEENALFHSNIIELNEKFHFGKLKRASYEMWLKLCQSGITFELLYDPMGFIALKHYFENDYDGLSNIMYIHQGGLLGNQSMLPRYQRKYPELA